MKALCAISSVINVLDFLPDVFLTPALLALERRSTSGDIFDIFGLLPKRKK